MNFSRVTPWAQVSDCGHYSVACARVNGAYRFEAWHLPGKAELLGSFDNAEDARKACTEHKKRLELA